MSRREPGIVRLSARTTTKIAREIPASVHSLLKSDRRATNTLATMATVVTENAHTRTISATNGPTLPRDTVGIVAQTSPLAVRLRRFADDFIISPSTIPTGESVR